MQGTGISTDESSWGKGNTRQEVQHSKEQRIEKNEGRKETKGEISAEGDNKVLPSYANNTELCLLPHAGKEIAGLLSEGMAPSSPPGCTGEHTQEGQNYAGRAEPSQLLTPTSRNRSSLPKPSSTGIQNTPSGGGTDCTKAFISGFNHYASASLQGFTSVPTAVSVIITV